VLVRPARPGDAEALVQVFADWSHALPADAIAERLRAWADEPRAELLVAEHDGAVVGVAAVSAGLHVARPGRLARLAGLAVRADARRLGAGAALVRAAEKLARGWGCDRLEATSSRWREEAPGFYAALGYEDLSSRQARYSRDL
jgi:N-acetylglutamate synthase-like GNAT family acetyltransferase